jgi:hypothetical protein
LVGRMIPESEIVETGALPISTDVTVFYTFHRDPAQGVLRLEMFIVPRVAGAPASIDSAGWEAVKIALDARWDALLCMACYFEANENNRDPFPSGRVVHTCKPLDSTVEVARESLKVNSCVTY